MDESVDTSNELPLLHEKHGRLSSLSKKLNELTSNAFRRFRASNTAASSEESSNVQPKSYLPTLSFGSGVSSLFGDLNIDRAADDTDSSQAKKEDSKEAGVERTTPNSRRNSQLTYGSTSSFFGNSASGAMYPKELLEKPDSTTWEKETANTSLRQGDNPQPSQSFQQSRRSYRRRGSQSSLSENLEPSCTEASKLTEDLTIAPNRHRRSAGLIPSTVKPSRQTPIHLANKSFIKRPSARNRVGSTPPIAPSKSSNPPPSTHIKEHRLMTLISPPHPRTNSLAAPFDTSPGQTNHQSSHHKPIFTRTTSSSTAPTTQIPRSHKPPPAPLKLTGGNKTLNMTGFGAARARAIADRESETIGKQAAADQEGSSQQAAHGANDKMSTSSGAPGTGSSPRPSNSPASQGSGVKKTRNLSLFEHRRVTHYASTPDFHAAPALESKPPVPRIPERFASRFPPAQQNLATNSDGTGIGHPSMSSPNARPGPARSALVSRPAQGTLSYARSASNLKKSYGSRIPRSVTATSNAGALLESIEAKISGLQLLGGERHEDPTAHGSGPWETAQSPSTGRTWPENAPAAREQIPAQALLSSYVPPTAGQLPSLPVEVTDLDVDDTSFVETPQPAEYWAGRFSTANDHMRDKAQTFASRVRWARDNTRRHDEVMRYLKGKCRTAAAEESLAAFVRKWEAVGAEWFGEEWAGTVEVGAGAGAMPVKKKGGFLGLFGRKKKGE